MTTTPHSSETLRDTIDAALRGGATATELVSWSALNSFYGHDSSADVDFAALYPEQVCQASTQERMDEDFFCDECCWPQRLTPRQACALLVQVSMLLDLNFNNWGPDLESLEDLLPPICWPYLRDDLWLVQFAHALYRLQVQLATGAPLSVNSTAEEMALHLAFEDVDGLLEDMDLSDLPEFPADDSSLYLFKADLVEDEDVLMLFDPRLDGIEDSELAESLGMVNLHPRDWFTPFRSAEQSSTSL
jgi:hypothetical protein